MKCDGIGMGKWEEGPALWAGRASADALLWRGGEFLWVGGGDKDMDVVKVIGRLSV